MGFEISSRSCSFLTALSILASTSSFSQDKLLQDGKVVIEHPNCRLTIVAEDHWNLKELHPRSKHIFKSKGYTTKFMANNELPIFDKIMEAPGLVLGIRYAHRNQEKGSKWGIDGYLHLDREELRNSPSLWNGEDALATVSTDSMPTGMTHYKGQILERPLFLKSRFKRNITQLVDQLPHCEKTVPPANKDQALSLGVEIGELNACIDSYRDRSAYLEVWNESDTYRLLANGGLALVFFGGTPLLLYTGIGVIFGSTFNVPVIASKVIQEKNLNNSIVLTEAVKECRLAEADGKSCEAAESQINQLRRRKRNQITRLIDRMGMEEFSKKYSDYITRNRICSRADMKTRQTTVDKTFKRARRNF